MKVIPPKEKAQELINEICVHIDKHSTKGGISHDAWNERCKTVALITVDEILSLFEQNKFDSRYEYYQAVKRELM